MTLFPVVARELRVAARRARTYWQRVVIVLLAIGLGMLVGAPMAGTRPAAQGAAVFFTLAWLAWLYCVLAGVRQTADAISSERREGTLGLLFLTDLKGFDVVLGKLAATSLSAAYGLLAMAPVLAIPVLMGGVGMDQVVLEVLTLGATLAFSLAVGMFVSCWFTNARWAAGVTMLVLAGITVAPFMVLLLEANVRRPSAPNWVLAVPSPLLAQALAGTPNGPGKPMGFFWPSLACTAGWSVFFLAGACLALPRLWRWLPRWLTAPWPSARRSADPARAARRRQLLDRQPFLWLASPRPRIWPREVLLFLVLGVGWTAWTVAMEIGLDPGWLMFTSVALHSLYKARVAFAASRMLGEEVESGRIELLLTTPLNERAMMDGVIRAVARWALPWMGGLLLLDWLWLGPLMDRIHGDEWPMFLLAVLHMMALPIESLAMAGVAMRAAVRRGRSLTAGIEAVGLVMLLPLAGLQLVVIILSLWPEPAWLDSLSDEVAMIGSYGACYVWSGFLAAWSFLGLRRGLRRMASEPAAGRGWWRRLWAAAGAR